MEPRQPRRTAIADEVLSRGDVRNALDQRDFGGLFRLLRQYQGLSQTDISGATGLSQPRVSNLMTRRQQRVTSIEVIERIADGLRIPGALVGLAVRHWERTAAAPRAATHRPASEERVGRPAALDWRTDTLITLDDLGSADVDLDRRRVLLGAAYSVAAVAVPGQPWWGEMVERGRARAASGGIGVGRSDVDAVRDMVAMFSRVDQRRGGGHARTAVVQYLTADVAPFLRGRYVDERVRRDMFTAAGELAYLSGWMAFDNDEHAVAQAYFTTALKLAAEADDQALAGHVMRAMAHQAVDLGHHRDALAVASASVADSRYRAAGPRERALLGVVHARALAVTGGGQATARALLRAEDDLASAEPGSVEPDRVFFFGEASLAHQTACALRDTGNLPAAEEQFRRSIRTRKASSFTRTHAVTLGHLGEVQAKRGEIEGACDSWLRSLDAMQGVRSGRTRTVASTMRRLLAPVREHGSYAVATVDARAEQYLAATA